MKWAFTTCQDKRQQKEKKNEDDITLYYNDYEKNRNFVYPVDEFRLGVPE